MSGDLTPQERHERLVDPMTREGKGWRAKVKHEPQPHELPYDPNDPRDAESIGIVRGRIEYLRRQIGEYDEIINDRSRPAAERQRVRDPEWRKWVEDEIRLLASRLPENHSDQVHVDRPELRRDWPRRGT